MADRFFMDGPRADCEELVCVLDLLIWRRLKNSTASTKVHCSTAITKSMGLKLRWQRKHQPRLIFGLTAQLQSEQIGQRKRK